MSPFPRTPGDASDAVVAELSADPGAGGGFAGGGSGILADAAALLNDALGPDSHTESALAQMLADPAQALFGAYVHGQLVGVASARLLAPSDLPFYECFGPGHQVLYGKTVGSLYTSAVTPSMRGRGIGKTLALARLAWLGKRGCDYAVGMSWLSGLAHTSRPVFERLGFSLLGSSDTIYFELSSAQGWGCVVCGSPCRCPGALYGKALDPDIT